MPLLEVNQLVKSYSGRTVVDRVSLQIEAGEIVGLLGRNGAGKTTSFRMTIGMISPEAGQVIFGGRDVTTMPMYKHALAGMGYPMPARACLYIGMVVTSRPPNITCPASGLIMPIVMRKLVVFPAPLRPSSPTISPASIWRETRSTTVRPE